MFVLRSGRCFLTGLQTNNILHALRRNEKEKCLIEGFCDLGGCKGVRLNTLIYFTDFCSHPRRLMLFGFV